MHLHKCPELATFAGVLLLLLLVLVAATTAANTQNKQHELTLKANNTSAKPPPPPPSLAQIAASKRQINSTNSRRGQAKAAANNQSQRLISKYKLPSWFHFNTFKQLYGKRYPGGYVDELHKRIYLRTSLKVFEQRALYRSGRLDSLASVNELSDLTGEQLDQFRALRKNGSSTTESGAKQPIKGAQLSGHPQLPECCTYDQVYARIIGLLSAATNANDSALSRALVDELEQKPLVESDRNEPALVLEPTSSSKVAAGGNERPTPLVKSNKASAPTDDIDDKRAHKMIERRHRADGDGDGGDENVSKRVTKGNLTTGSHRKGGGVVAAAPAAKSNFAPDHQTASDGGRLRHARPATSASQPTRPISSSSNRSTTIAGSKPVAGNTQQPLSGRKLADAHSGPADDEDERSASDLGVPKEIEEAVRAQVAEQLSSSSPLGRELSKQMSAYFGQPVEIRAVPDSPGPKQAAHKSSPHKPRQQQQQLQQQQQSAPSTRAV